MSDETGPEDTSCGPDRAHALGPCTCATDGHARRCPHHTQEDFDAADAVRGAPVDATLADSERDLLWWTVKSREAFARVERVVERILAQRAAVDHAKIEAVRAVHSRRTDTGLNARNGSRIYSCSECGKPAPCPTIRALDDATTRPPPCPSRWADNRGVHCAEREGHPGQHGNGVVSWSEAEAAG